MNTAYSYEIQPLDEHSISIERVYGTTPVVVIPEQIDGFTVKRIGAYCFSESKHVPADAVTIGGVDSFMKALCGNDIEEISLPDSVEQIGNLAFYNCRKLRTLTMGRFLKELGSDAFMNCRSLKRLVLRSSMEEASGVQLILNQVRADLEVEFKEALFFYPEYYDSYEEIGPAHIFALNIAGEGFRARQCFHERMVDAAAYDMIFERICIEEKMWTAARMALCRLAYPVELKEEARERYLSYLKEHASEVCDVLIQKKDLVLLELICRLQVMERSGITALIEQAAEAGWAEGSVSLSSWQQKYYKEEAASSCYDIEW